MRTDWYGVVKKEAQELNLIPRPGCFKHSRHYGMNGVRVGPQHFSDFFLVIPLR